MCWRITWPLNVGVSGYPKKSRIVSRRDIWLRVGINVIKPSPEPNIDPLVISRVILRRMIQDSLVNQLFGCIRDFCPRTADPKPTPFLPYQYASSFSCRTLSSPHEMLGLRSQTMIEILSTSEVQSRRVSSPRDGSRPCATGFAFPERNLSKMDLYLDHADNF